jgi:hypothetical protein
MPRTFHSVAKPTNAHDGRARSAVVTRAQGAADAAVSPYIRLVLEERLPTVTRPSVVTATQVEIVGQDRPERWAPLTA